MSITTEELSRSAVMVRAFGGEPVRLTARSHRGQYVEVVGADQRMAIGFPARDVFEMDEALFGRLKAAHGDGETDELRRLWSRAARWLRESAEAG